MAQYDWLSSMPRWSELFCPAIRKVLKQVHPTMHLDDKAAQLMDMKMYSMMAHLCSKQNSAPSTIAECQSAVLDLLPEELASWAIHEADEAIAVYNQVKKKSAIRTEFPVEKVHQRFIKEVFREHIEIVPVIYLMAVLDYVTADVLRLAGTYATNYHSSTITRNDIEVAIKVDEALQSLFSLLEKLPTRADTVVYTSYFETIKDFITAERRFAESMELILRVFYDSFESAQSLTVEGRLLICEAETNTVFAMIKQIHELSERLVADLEDDLTKAELDDSMGSFGDIFQDVAVNNELDDLRRHTCECYGPALETLHTLLSRPVFRDYLHRLEPELLTAAEYELPRLLAEPGYHFLHLAEALEIIINTAQMSFGHQYPAQLEALKEAVAKLKPEAELLREANFGHLDVLESYNRMPKSQAVSQQAVMKQLQASIEGFDGVDLAGCCHSVVRQGPLNLMSEKYKKGVDRYVIVLDGAILFCKQIQGAKSHKFKMKERISTRGLNVELSRVQDGYVITVQGPNTDVGFAFSTSTEAKAWMSALVMPSNKRYLSKAYVAKQQEYERTLPSYMPDTSEYPFSEPDNDTNIRFSNPIPKVEQRERSSSFRTSSFELQRSGAPELKGGTLVKLVERLTFPQYADMSFVRHFLVTYRSFTTPDELLDLLIARYNVPEPKGADRSHLRRFQKKFAGPVRLRVVNVIKQWVDKHFYDFQQSDKLLARLLRFVRDHVGTDVTMTNTVKGLTRTIARKRSEAKKKVEKEKWMPDSPAPQPLLTSDGPLHILTMHPIEVARQMTLIESEMFRAITPSELVGQPWSKSAREQKAPHVTAFIHRFNTVSRWVTRTIVETPDFSERVEVVAFFLEILRELHKLNNFNGVMELVSGLNFSAVERLKHTFAEVSRNSRRIKVLEDCRLVVSQAKSFANLRARMASISPPCVPFLGMFLTDITFIEDGSPDFLPVDPSVDDETAKREIKGSNLINFGKRRLVAKAVGQIQQFQTQPYNLLVVPQMREFLITLPSLCEDAIPLPPPNAGKRLIEAFETAVYNQSLKIEPRDALDKASLPSAARLLAFDKTIKSKRDAILNQANALQKDKSRNRSGSTASSTSTLRRMSGAVGRTPSTSSSSMSSADKPILPPRMRSVSQIMDGEDFPPTSSAQGTLVSAVTEELDPGHDAPPPRPPKPSSPTSEDVNAPPVPPRRMTTGDHTDNDVTA